MKVTGFCLLFVAMALAAAGDGYEAARSAMVQSQIAARGISDRGVLAAMLAVPRHLFVPPDIERAAYSDRALPIGEGQTISQPYIVALMTESLRLSGKERVLEVGTGSGYQAAVLSRLAAQVYSMEIRSGLAEKASSLLASLGYGNVAVQRADGYYGWPDQKPFDCIMITAAVDHIPPPLLGQLKDGGRLVLPLGNPLTYQTLTLVTKKGSGYTVSQILDVLFVPMVSDAIRGSR